MDNIDQTREAEIHKRQLYITEEILSFCKEQNIKCFLTGGSLLGAVKLQDIIPGDKDVDIGMLREDYEKFFVAAKYLPSDLQILEPRTCNSYNWLFAKVFQKGTRLIPKKKSPYNSEVGIYVDIIPYDYIEAKHQDKIYLEAKLKKWFLLTKTPNHNKRIKEKIISTAGLFWKRGDIIDGFSKIKPPKEIIQNIVGGSPKDWFYSNEVEELNEVELARLRVPIPKWKRYLDLNYPDWETSDISRQELKDYEVEFKQSYDLEFLHSLQLEMATEIKRICEKHGIRFFLVDGTALSAVNIGDFLPWDDDMDIGMYWPDYLRFIEICKTELKPCYKMKDFQLDTKFGCSFGQMINKKYLLIQENNQEAVDEKGVFIDIHPFSNCSNFRVFRLIDYYRFKVLKLCILERRGYMSVSSLKRSVFKTLNRLFSEEYIERGIYKMRDRKPGKYAMKIHGRHPEDLICVDNLDRLGDVHFHGITFPIQPDATRMLDSVYGQFDINKVEMNRHRILSVEKNKDISI